MALDIEAAKTKIEEFFEDHGKKIDVSKLPSGSGKVYELFCLSKTVECLKCIPGVEISLEPRNGTSVDFQASPGRINLNRSHFVVRANGKRLTLHTDIGVMTLSHAAGYASGRSSWHEFDIVLVRDAARRPRPRHDQVVLAVECKAHAKFRKPLVRMALGMRRELSSLGPPGRYSRLAGLYPTPPRESLHFPADPGSEFWLAYPDEDGNKYKLGPDMYGIEFKHWCPCA